MHRALGILSGQCRAGIAAIKATQEILALDARHHGHGVGISGVEVELACGDLLGEDEVVADRFETVDERDGALEFGFLRPIAGGQRNLGRLGGVGRVEQCAELRVGAVGGQPWVESERDAEDAAAFLKIDGLPHEIVGLGALAEHEIERDRVEPPPLPEIHLERPLILGENHGVARACLLHAPEPGEQPRLQPHGAETHVVHGGVLRVFLVRGFEAEPRELGLALQQQQFAFEKGLGAREFEIHHPRLRLRPQGPQPEFVVAAGERVDELAEYGAVVGAIALGQLVEQLPHHGGFAANGEGEPGLGDDRVGDGPVLDR